MPVDTGDAAIRRRAAQVPHGRKIARQRNFAHYMWLGRFEVPQEADFFEK